MTLHDDLRAGLERSNLIAARMTPDGRKITTNYDLKPIPARGFDWCATFGGYEPGDPMGWGATEIDAIADLLDLLEE